MSKHTCLSLAVLLSATMLAGCATDTNPPTEVGFDGEFRESPAGFQMIGELGVLFPRHTPYEDVEVQLHGAQGEVYDRESIGALGVQTVAINISSEQIPEAVTIVSPDFWSNQVDVPYFCRDGDWSRHGGEIVDEEGELLRACEGLGTQ